MRGGDDDAGTGSTHGMAERNARTVRVEARIICRNVPFFEYSQRLGGKGLIELNEVKIIEGDAEAIHNLAGSLHRADTHAFRIHAG